MLTPNQCNSHLLLCTKLLCMMLCVYVCGVWRAPSAPSPPQQQKYTFLPSKKPQYFFRGKFCLCTYYFSSVFLKLSPCNKVFKYNNSSRRSRLLTNFQREFKALVNIFFFLSFPWKKDICEYKSEILGRMQPL